MKEEPLEGLDSGREPVEEDVGQSTEKESSEAQKTSEAAENPDTKEDLSSGLVEETPGEEKDEAKATGGEPPVDWFEPLEDDDDDDAKSVGRNDPEEESLAGESERSESMADSEKALKKTHQ